MLLNVLNIIQDALTAICLVRSVTLQKSKVKLNGICFINIIILYLFRQANGWQNVQEILLY